MVSSEPARNTEAWTTASNSGFTPSSGGMSGKTAAPSGTSASAAMSASGYRGNNTHLVAIFDRGLQVIQVAHVLVIEIDIHETAHLAVLKEALRDSGKFLPEMIERRLDRTAGHLDHGLAFGVLPHRRRDMNSNRHDNSMNKSFWLFVYTSAVSRLPSSSASNASREGLIAAGCSK